MNKRQCRLRMKETYRSLNTWDASKFVEEHEVLKCFTEEEQLDMALEYLGEACRKHGFTRLTHAHGKQVTNGYFVERIH